MGLDFNYTCSIIDKNILGAKDILINNIIDILGDACNFLPKETKKELAITYSHDIYKQLEDIFEETRTCNEDMRKQADWQIDNLEDTINDLQEEIKELERKLENYE
jgi:hypothetical protein